jgi:hypothetical protein
MIELALKKSSTYNWLVLAYLILVAILTLNSNLAYGQGFGDIIYLGTSVILILLQLIITLIIYRKQKGHFNPTAFYTCGTVFLLFAIYLTWEFTFGRGSEFIWNGNIFYKKPF